MAVYATCAHCGGTGTCSPDKNPNCKTCGSGTVACKICGGTGKVKLPD